MSAFLIIISLSSHSNKKKGLQKDGVASNSIGIIIICLNILFRDWKKQFCIKYSTAFFSWRLWKGYWSLFFVAYVLAPCLSPTEKQNFIVWKRVLVTWRVTWYSCVSDRKLKVWYGYWITVVIKNIKNFDYLFSLQQNQNTLEKSLKKQKII